MADHSIHRSGAMKPLLACWLSAIAVLVWMAMAQPTTFSARWQPVVEHPLSIKGNARSSFCSPRKCLIG
jgi:hypothetical protein